MGVVLCPVLLGREAELAMLRAALAAAGQGHGGLLALTGEPGVGKSRLLAELSGEASSAGMTVATGRAVPAGTVTPYRPLAEALLQAVRDRHWPPAAAGGAVVRRAARRAVAAGRRGHA